MTEELPESTVDFVQSPSAPFQIQVAKDAKSAGVWRLKHVSYSAIFPPEDRPSKSLVRRARVHDPNFVPIWCKKVFLTPADTEVQGGYMIIGRYVPAEQVTSEGGPQPVKLENWPGDFPFDPMRIYAIEPWCAEWPKGSWGAKQGWPEVSLPFDERVIEYVMQQEWVRSTMSYDEMVRWLQKFEDDKEAELEQISADIEYGLKQDWAGIKKSLEEENFGPRPEEPRAFLDLQK